MFSALPGYESANVNGLVVKNPMVRSTTSNPILSADTLTASSTSVIGTEYYGYPVHAFNSGMRYFEVNMLVTTTYSDSGYLIGLNEVSGATVAAGTTYVHRKVWFISTGYNDFYNDATKAVAGFGTKPLAGDVISVVADMGSGLVMRVYLNGVLVNTAPGALVSGSYYDPAIGFYLSNLPASPFSIRFNGGDEPFSYFTTIAAISANAGLVPWNNGL
jgi:hypothetical protein